MSKYILLNESPLNNFRIYIMFFIMLLSSLILVYKVKTYDSIALTGIINCENECQISFTLPYNQIDNLSNDSIISYKEVEYKINGITYEEPYLSNSIPYQDVIVLVDLKSEEKIINFKLLSNKQRIITKLKNKILER